jgi:predicted transcriptional regulator
MHGKIRDSLVVLSHLEDGCSLNLPSLCEKTSFDERTVKSHIKYLQKSGLIFDNGIVIRMQVQKLTMSQF